MKKGLLITARLKSTRLNLKLLIELQGKEVIRHVIDRAKKVHNIDEIVLCTSTDPQDYALVEIAKQENIHYFMGDGTDVLKRLRDAATFYNIDHFVSITADNPFFCVHHADKTIEMLRKNPSTDYTYIEGLPIGLTVYGLRTHAINIVCKFKDQVDTEIWGLFLNHPEIFNVEKIIADPIWGFDSRLTLDQPEDLEYFNAIVDKFQKNVSDMNTLDIKKIVDDYKDLASINSGVVQKGIDEEQLVAIGKLYSDKSDYLQTQLGHK